METIVLVNSVIFIIFSGICIFIGLNPKKWYSWLFGLYGFFSGFSFGYMRAGMSLGLQIGFLFSLIIMSGGIMMRRQRQNYSDIAEQWVLHNSQDKHFSLLTTLIKKLLKK